MTPGGRLRSEMVKALNADGRPMIQIAEDADLSVDTIWGIRKNRGIPLHETVVALAEAVNADGIIGLSIAIRAKACEVCGNAFVDMSRRMNRVYCSKRCLTLNRQRVLRGSRARVSMVTAQRLREHQEAVAAYCHGCEPQGICRDAQCSLRPVSPLTFIPMTSFGRVA